MTSKANPSEPPLIRYADEMRAFLQSDEQKVLLLHGRWGVGKTYFWRHFVEAEQEYVKESFCSYVSLFGASSVAHVKSLILFGGKAVRPAEDLPTLARRIGNIIARKRRYLPDISLPHVGNIGSAMGAFDELLIKNYLVCFDDLERRNKQLDLEQFLGLVSLLKEQNDCRIVIICNETELSEDDLRTLNKYREKIVDRQLTYCPVFDENFRVIFPTGDEAIREVFERLRLNNIRVFQQTRWCVGFFEPLLKNRHDVFVQRFRQQCAKLAAAHFAYSKEVTLEKIKSTSWMLAGWEERRGVSDPSTELLTQLQFMPSQADDFIIAYLRDGYCNLAELEPIIDQLNHEYKRSEADMFLGRFWDSVWDTYHKDTARVLQDAQAMLNQYHAYLPFKYSADVLKFLQRIDPTFDVEPLKERAANAWIPAADFATLHDILAECKSTAIQKAAKEKEAALKPRKAIRELVVALGESDGWNPGDFSLMNEYSEAELLEWTAAANDPNILFILAQAIARGQLESADNYDGKEVGKKFRAVFDRLAQRSLLDGQRTIRTFERVRSFLQQYGKEASSEICPPPPPAQDH